MIKKTIKNITLTGAMLITLASFTTKADAANATGTVTANSLNVRSGASTSYSVVGKLTKGETVEILSSNDGWYKVQYDDNKTGNGVTQPLKNCVDLHDVRGRISNILYALKNERTDDAKKQLLRLYKLVDAMINQGF